MLLAVDVGNTRTTVGLFDGATLRHRWRVATHAPRSADEIAVLLRSLRALDDAPPPDRAILASVVPAAERAWREAVGERMGVPTDVVTAARAASHLRVETDRPEEVGADRIVNAVAATAYPGDAWVVVDLGTATTFDLVLAPDRLRGVAIAPGLEVAAEALATRAAKLGTVELTAPDRAVGRTTGEAVRSGLVLGHAAMVDGMVDRFVAEARAAVGAEARITVLATGGLAGVVAGASARLDAVEPWLTLEGLRRLAYDA